VNERRAVREPRQRAASNKPILPCYLISSNPEISQPNKNNTAESAENEAIAGEVRNPLEIIQ